MQKIKVLSILHRSPPSHGASKVGDFISSSKNINEAFECYYITIKSSDTISDIGKISFKKIYLVIELYIKVLWALISFRPDKIYFTASISGVAFYRDLFISSLWKIYKVFKNVDIHYHYHTKGINNFISTSTMNKKLTSFFLTDINLILLSPLLLPDFENIKSFNKVNYLPNGVENNISNIDFIKKDRVDILYLSNMIKSKGYFDVLELAEKTKDRDIYYHFAGGWQNSSDKEEFFRYIEENNLSNKVIFYGFIDGTEKSNLFNKCDIFIFPTRYKNEAFPLTILEALSYGVPVISTDEGSIPYILDEKSGIILNDLENLEDTLDRAIDTLLNEETSIYCRDRYLNNFTLERFENNFINIFKESRDV
ncbi:Glycosyltransferase [hydrothermal vent metagenome]|uniref:Glycosyltransferase n=1 Tax=hydrothermal vent metagenome TaxID=652676 RepID=A0A1W1CEI3_9ZZZZ